MGREVKRVALDFDWPMKEVWPLYYLSICRAVDEDCEKCAVLAKNANFEMDEGKCPVTTWRDPPIGEGYQMWETTSEGSPMSPVFATPEELAQWLADNGASAFGRMTLNYEQWLAFIVGPGRSPSAFMTNRGAMISGVQGMIEPTP